MKKTQKQTEMNNGTETMNAAQVKLDATLAQKEATYLLEKELFRRNRADYEGKLEQSRQLANGDPTTLAAIAFIEAFTLLGVHPSYALKVWGLITFRRDLSGAELE